MPEMTKLLDKWAGQLAQALEMMTGQQYGVSPVSPAGGPPGLAVLWWTQSLSVAPGASISIGVDTSTWFELGTRALQGAGIETVEESEARSTWLEIVQQSVSGAMRAAQSLVGITIECADYAESDPPSGSNHYVMSLTAPDGKAFDIGVAVSPKLILAIAPPAAPPAPPVAVSATNTASGRPTIPVSKTMDVLLDVHLPVSISFGTAHLALKDVLKLATGSVVELNRLPEEPVDIIVNDYVIARGEVVVVDGNYAVRIQEIVSRQQRLGITDSPAGR